MLKKIMHKVTTIIVVSGFVVSAFSWMAVQAIAGPAEQDKPDFSKFGKVLIIYYSLSGNTREMAQVIHNHTGGDLYDLQIMKEYPPIPEIYEVIKQELADNQWPEVKQDWPDMAQYDVIFVGGPVWWYTLPTPLLSFLAKADFKNNPLVPFCSHGGNYGEYFKRFALEAKNAQVQKGLDFYAPLQSTRGYLNSKVVNWLNSLQLPQAANQ